MDLSHRIASLGTQNSVIYKLSGNKLRISVAGICSSYADYKLPNGQYLSDSRMEDMGGKLKLGYNSGKWALAQLFIFEFTIGIPGHTHDLNPSPESFMLEEQKRLLLYPVKNSKSFWKHQGQLLHQFQKQNGIL